jgi:hypothetical protein
MGQGFREILSESSAIRCSHLMALESSSCFKPVLRPSPFSATSGSADCTLVLQVENEVNKQGVYLPKRSSPITDLATYAMPIDHWKRKEFLIDLIIGGVRV